jgi:hypothetical protein
MLHTHMPARESRSPVDFTAVFARAVLLIVQQSSKSIHDPPPKRKNPMAQNMRKGGKDRPP